ncbi:OsmC family protein [Halomonas sp. TRM85114]|uniref:OsmC family protein n=1 Tax=Halomonas jincaotanensis TaxID=2810616 RepID=UPI001BD57762|nr:OsmC family protein [Halomonas jincaotanensis]MBS9405351.1 OsmC family protein [Halomonas jincaotanensis]
MSVAEKISSFTERQDSLNRHYLEVPEDAWITDHARALPSEKKDPVHGAIEMANSVGPHHQHGIHSAVGGDQDAPNPGDYLCAGLAACLHSTLRMVAERLGVTILNSEVMAKAQVDVRGALMVDASVPVGFQRLHCDVSLEVPADTGQRTIKTLMAGAEHCCIVFQTLQGGTKVTTDWRIDQIS